MAQTTGALSGVAGKLEVSTDGTTWTDISGSTNTVKAGSQPRDTGETYTFQSDTGIVTGGKRKPIELDVKIVYTRITGEAFEVMRTIHETAGGYAYLRYSIGGGASGDFLFTSAKGVVSSFDYPDSATDDAKPVMAGFKFKTPSLTKSVLP